MQVTIEVPPEALLPLIEATVRVVMAEKPVTVEAVPEPEPVSEPAAETKAAETKAAEPAVSEPPAASLPDDFNILQYAKAWVSNAEDETARRTWLKDELARVGVKSLAALTDEQLIAFKEAMDNAAV
jgi:hypothetical protein